MEVLGYEEARNRLAGLSARLFDAAQMNGGKEGFWAFAKSDCDDSNGDAIPGLYKLRHIWNWDDVAPDRLNPAVERIRELLGGWPGWDVSNFRYTTDTHSAILTAYGPDNTFWVDVEVVPDYKRVTFTVALPCARFPAEELRPSPGSTVT
ncbi:hypothetical protein [Yinghuangia seranimata]|uniref:hypothetical protein n=1 Tax=Yinghuangia seranimata TaxID=408067 RepID=UPI00248B87B4|nr:hypothetical protein [Yinghuangia seranimata]MDI2128190.1 hypothetical protein [Yinghuangia seranimata]